MEDRWFTDWTPSPRWPHYTRANAGEVLPTPASPLGQTFCWESGICIGWRDGYVRQGNYLAEEFNPDYPDVCGFFGARFYINLAQVRMIGVRNPVLTVEQMDLAFFGAHPDVPPYVPHPEDDKPEYAPRILEYLNWIMTTTEWPEYDKEKAQTIAFRASRPALGTLSDAELLERARSTQPMLVKLFDSHTMTSSASGVAPGILFSVGEAIGDPTVPMKLVAGIGEIDSAEASYTLWDLSRLVAASPELSAAFDAGLGGLLGRLREGTSPDVVAFLAAWDRFLLDQGSRGPIEWEISAESWETRPEMALAALDRIRLQRDAESPRHRNRAQATEREQVTVEVRAKLAALGNEELSGQFEAALVASSQMGFRERTKTNIIRVVHEDRMIFRELGRRHAEAGDIDDPAHIFMLVGSELDAFVADPASFRRLLAGRYTDWRELWDLEPPFFIKDGVVPPLSQWPKAHSSTAAKLTAGEVLQGVAGCPGVVRSRARVILDPTDPGALEPGDILVAPSTDPSWTPLFMAASGVVVDVGGQISHSIIVSRELGLPCVISATDATVRIPDGAEIEVDGGTGAVTVISVPV